MVAYPLTHLFELFDSLTQSPSLELGEWDAVLLGPVGNLERE